MVVEERVERWVGSCQHLSSIVDILEVQCVDERWRHPTRRSRVDPAAWSRGNHVHRMSPAAILSHSAIPHSPKPPQSEASIMAGMDDARAELHAKIRQPKHLRMEVVRSLDAGQIMGGAGAVDLKRAVKGSGNGTI